MGEDREKVESESTEDVEAHNLEHGNLPDEEREALQDDDVEGHTLIAENFPAGNLET